jgi:hypothetical protein
MDGPQPQPEAALRRWYTYPRVRQLNFSLKTVEKDADRRHQSTKALAEGTSDRWHGEVDLRAALPAKLLLDTELLAPAD